MKSAEDWLVEWASTWDRADKQDGLGPLDVFRAIQADALEAAVDEAGCGHNDCMDESARRIRALKPPLR